MLGLNGQYLIGFSERSTKWHFILAHKKNKQFLKQLNYLIGVIKPMQSSLKQRFVFCGRLQIKKDFLFNGDPNKDAGQDFHHPEAAPLLQENQVRRGLKGHFACRRQSRSC
ncbi:hypothetical protein FKM82_011864 [Ascaphus truei]